MRSIPLYFFLFVVISSINIGIGISKPSIKYVGDTTGLNIGDDSLCLRFEFKHLNEGMIFNVLKTGVGCKTLDTEEYQKDKYYLFSIEFENSKEKIIELVLDLDAVGEAYLYEVGKRDLLNKQVAGTLVSYPQKSNKEKLNTEYFNIKLPPEQISEFALILRFSGKGNTNNSIIIQYYDQWFHKRKDAIAKNNLEQGFFHGIIWVLVLLSAYFFILSGDKAAFYYALSIASCSLFILYTYDYIPDLFDRISARAHILIAHSIIILSIYTYIHFLVIFTQTNIRFPSWYNFIRFSQVVLVLTIIMLGGYFLFNDISLSRYLAVRYIGHFLFMIIYLLYSLKMIFSGDRPDYKYVIISAVVLIMGGGITILLQMFNPNGEYNYYSYQGAVLIQVFVLAFGMVSRYRRQLLQRNQYKNQLIEQLEKNESIQKGLNEKLEREVHRRTEEILAQNEELTQQQEELSRQRNVLEQQKLTITTQNEQLQKYNENLEKVVDERTKKLKLSNREISRQKTQLEHFSYLMAHNLRAPVAQIKGLTNLINLERKQSYSDEILNRLAHSADELDNTLKDVNQVLQLRQGLPLKYEGIDIELILDEILNEYRDDLNTFGVQITKDIKINEIEAPGEFIKKILSNLISNAIKYRSLDRKANIRLASHQKSNAVYIDIEDNGVGIDLVKTRNKLFGFYQRFNETLEGKGLGLFMVKQLTDALDWDIRVKSKVDFGTTFTIIIPQPNEQ